MNEAVVTVTIRLNAALSNEVKLIEKELVAYIGDRYDIGFLDATVESRSHGGGSR